MVISELLSNNNLVEMVVPFSKIKAFERMEERFFDIEKEYGDILGMNVDSVEFCPNNNPSSKDEILPWLWVIHPEEKEEILKYADATLKRIIKDYEESDSE